MGFNVRNNCHVQIWKNGALPPGPPAGPPTYDGPAQQLVPYMVSGLPSPYRGRLALAPGLLVITNADIQSPTSQCWLRFVDDVRAVNLQYWRIVDMNLSSDVNPLNPLQYTATAMFLTYILST